MSLNNGCWQIKILKKLVEKSSHYFVKPLGALAARPHHFDFAQ